jgi:transcriptional regulator with XRE-family HTH domain
MEWQKDSSNYRRGSRMIRNDRQLSIAKEKQEALLNAASTAEPSDATIYRDLADEVQQEIDEYIEIRDGYVNLFAIESIDDLGAAATKARIARRWTQKRLADSLGVSEQMVQKDESRGYEKAGVARLAEVVDVLGYQLVGELRPVHLSPDQWKGPAGFLIGTPSGNWTIESPSTEFKLVTSVSGGFESGVALSQFFGPMIGYNFGFRSEIIELTWWGERTVVGSTVTSGGQQLLVRAES